MAEINRNERTKLVGGLPSVDGLPRREVVKRQVFLRQKFGEHDYLPGVHGKGKRNPNRFPFFC